MSLEKSEFATMQRKAKMHPFSDFAAFCIKTAGIRATHITSGKPFAKYELWQYCGGKTGEQTAQIIKKCHPDFTFRMVEIKAEGEI